MELQQIQAKFVNPLTDLISEDREFIIAMNATALDDNYFEKKKINVCILIFNNVVLICENKRTDLSSANDMIKNLTPDNGVTKHLEPLFAARIKFLKIFGYTRRGPYFCMLIDYFNSPLQQTKFFFRIGDGELDCWCKFVNKLDNITKRSITIKNYVVKDFQDELHESLAKTKVSFLSSCLKPRQPVVVSITGIHSIERMIFTIMQGSKRSLSVTWKSEEATEKSNIQEGSTAGSTPQNSSFGGSGRSMNIGGETSGKPPATIPNLSPKPTNKSMEMLHLQETTCIQEKSMIPSFQNLMETFHKRTPASDLKAPFKESCEKLKLMGIDTTRKNKDESQSMEVSIGSRAAAGSAGSTPQNPSIGGGSSGAVKSGLIGDKSTNTIFGVSTQTSVEGGINGGNRHIKPPGAREEQEDIKSLKPIQD